MKNMKVYYFLLTLLLGFSSAIQSPIWGQEYPKPSLKYGKPSAEELSMTTFAPDTSAVAVVLYHTGKSKYVITEGYYSLQTEYSKKIKILKSGGVYFSDIGVPYYSPENQSNGKAIITDLEACSYNLENGKTVRSSTSKEFIVRERIDERTMLLKFSIPSVRVGSVIEYRYTLTSEFSHRIDNWIMQDKIPVLFSEYVVDIPLTLDFGAEIRGPEHVTVKEKEGTSHATYLDKSIGIGKIENLIFTTRNLTMTSRNLPALRQDEKYLWCPDDHMVQISFELKGSQDSPDGPYRPRTQKWEDIDRKLLEDESFGALLSYPNPYLEEMKAMQIMELSKEERVATIVKLLNKKMAWNGVYRLFSRNLTKAIQKGEGSNADLNFVLLSMLRDAGVKAYPVALSTRWNGILPVTYPSIDKLNTFVIGLELEDNKLSFIDSSTGTNSYLNLLPLSMMPTRARVISMEVNEKWVDLSRISNNLTSINIEGKIQPNATITGTRTTNHNGQTAVDFRKEYFAVKDSTAYLEKRSLDENCQISQFRTEGVYGFTDKIKETYTFSKQSGNATDEFLYINPLIFPHMTWNPLIQSSRQLPVEFPYPLFVQITSQLTLPEGYTVEEIPKPISTTLGNKEMSYRYIVQVEGNTITTSYLFTQNKIQFPPDQYKQLQTMIENIAQKNTEMIVLKKIK